jgi:hypothetical protein
MNIFDQPRPSLRLRTAQRDELELYLATPCEDLGDTDPIEWWARCAGTFPTLSRMAMDYLSVPGTLDYL